MPILLYFGLFTNLLTRWGGGQDGKTALDVAREDGMYFGSGPAGGEAAALIELAMTWRDIEARDLTD